MPDGVWLLGLALGLAVDAGLALALALTGYQLAAADLPRLLTSGVSIAVLGTTGLPVVVAAARTGLQGALWWLERRDGSTMPLDGPKTPLPDSRDSEQGNYAIQDTDLSRAERARIQEIAHWRVFYRRLWAAGTAYGWDIRTLTGKKDPATKVMSQPAWNTGTHQLALARMVRKDETGTVPLVTDGAWNDGRLWERCPCPAGEPPDILPPPYTTTHTTPNNAKTAVIDA